jgi:hypothetical protein
MQAYHRRLAELWDKACRDGKLSTTEVVEWVECLNSHRNWVSKLNRLQNLADAAATVGDNEWERKVCEEMDKLIYKH